MLFDQWGSGAHYADDGNTNNTFRDDDYDEEPKKAAGEEEDEEDPIFRVIQLEWRPTAEQREIVAMATASDIVLVACSNNAVVWIKTHYSESPHPRCEVETYEHIAISKRGDDAIHKVFLDPSGSHALVGMKSGQNYYIHAQKLKPILCQKIKGVLLESVAWNTRAVSENSTKNILIGSSNGLIYEALIEERDKTFKKVYDLNSGNDKGAGPICGLQIEVFPGAVNDEKFLVVAATPNRIYEFIGGPTFEQMFIRYDMHTFQELPGSLGYSELRFYSPYQKDDGSSDSFAMLTFPGIYHGNVVFSSQTDPGDVVLHNKTLTPYSKTDAAESPLSICLTEFHFLLLKRGKLVALNRISEEPIFEYVFDPLTDGQLKALAPDIRRDKIWLYSSRFVFQVLKVREDRDIWKLHLDHGEFDQALKRCKTNEQREEVLSSQADSYFQQGMFELAAKHYAKTQRSFEEIALKFVNYRTPTTEEKDNTPSECATTNPFTSRMPTCARNALKTYLLEKLKTLDQTKKRMQQAMICTWLTEIFLDNLNRLQRESDTSVEAKNQLPSEQTEFRDFLMDWADVLNRNTTFELIGSHGRVEDLLFYAEIQNELEWMLTHHVQNRNYQAVLHILAEQTHPDKVSELFRKFCPALMAELPKETVDMLIQIDTLDPVKLLPALIRYEPKLDEKNHAIRFLENAIAKGCTNPAVHNYLVSLLAKAPDEKPLLNFIDKNKNNPIYDYKYALRLCHQQGKARACVGIYNAMGLYQEAVKLALEIDATGRLAKKVVTRAVGSDLGADGIDEEERKKLWLMIAKHVIVTENGKDISKAMSILKECDLLRLEDILPYFPDFVKIGDFKDEIIKSLEEYNRNIENLKNQMAQFTCSADLIRQDVQDVRNRSGVVSSSQKCDICSRSVLTRQFLLFPCTHVFHLNCLTDKIAGFFQNHPAMKKAAIAGLLQESCIDGDHRIRKQASGEVNEQDFLKEYASQNCFYCGEIMIEQVQEPFISLPEEKDQLKSWKV